MSLLTPKTHLKHLTAAYVSEGCDLSGKRVIVTGASSGIGQELARILALRGAEVIMACRNAEKTARVIAELEAELGDCTGHLRFEACDLSSMTNVLQFCERASEEPSQVDMLFFNGGVFAVPYRLTDEGTEYTYAANYLGHYLMLRSLLDAGKLAGGAHVIATMSEGGYQYGFAAADFEMLETPGEAGALRRALSRHTASPNSKVMLLLLMHHINHVIAPQRALELRFNSADPGPTLTDNINQMGMFMRLIAPLYTPWFMHSVERGAANLMWLATADDAARLNGVLVNHRFEEVTLPERRRDGALAARCWETSAEVIERALGARVF